MQPSQRVYRMEHPNSALVCAKGRGFLNHGTRRQPEPTVILVLDLSRVVKIHLSTR